MKDKYVALGPEGEMRNNRKGTIIEVDASAASNLDLMPRRLVVLALIHLLWGVLELSPRDDDAILDLVVGSFYFLNSLLLSRTVKPAAWATLIVVCVLTLGYGFMFVLNVVSYREIKHAKPMVLFVLGALCIVDTVRRLKNWEGLKVKRIAQLSYQRPFSIPAIAWHVLSFALGGAAVVAIFVFLYLTQKGANMNLASTIVFLMLMGGLAAAANFSYYRSRQHRASGAGSVFQKDERRPILLLRSFADDMIGIKQSGGLPLPFHLGEMRAPTFEEIITSELARYGPVVAIGRPGESLPPIGAAREYVTNEDWQRRVSSLVEDALAIVVLVGTTKGLAWELREISDRGAQRKVLVALPPRRPGSDQDDSLRRWKAFSELMREAGGWNVPDQINMEKTLLIDVEKGLLYEAARDQAGYRTALDEAIKGLVGRED